MIFHIRTADGSDLYVGVMGTTIPSIKLDWWSFPKYRQIFDKDKSQIEYAPVQKMVQVQVSNVSYFEPAEGRSEDESENSASRAGS